MKNSQKGQSVIEFSLITILVVAGILTSGPYVVRAINSHFKVADDSIKDSFSEKIKQAPLSPNNIPLNGSCSGLEDVACGNGVDCVQNAMVQQAKCNPLGFETTYGSRVSACTAAGCDIWYGPPAQGSSLHFQHCAFDPTCCKELGATGICGGTPQDVNPPYPICASGHMVMKRQCGSNPVTYYCSEATNSQCSGLCIGTKDQRAEWCPGDNTGAIPAGTKTTHVLYGKCTNPLKCEAQCFDGYVPSANKSTCVCPNNNNRPGETFTLPSTAVAANCTTCFPFNGTKTQSCSTGNQCFSAPGESSGRKTYRKQFNQRVVINIHLFTEDLEYGVYFYDKDGNITSQYVREEGEDKDDLIDSIDISGRAYGVYFWLREGGQRKSGDFGYTIEYFPEECCPVSVPSDEQTFDVRAGGKWANLPFFINMGSTGVAFRGDKVTADRVCKVSGFDYASQFWADDWNSPEDNRTWGWKKPTSFPASWHCSPADANGVPSSDGSWCFLPGDTFNAHLNYVKCFRNFKCVDAAWYNTDGSKSCDTFCSNKGLAVGASPENMNCATGENRPASGLGIINYRYGCAAGSAGACNIVCNGYPLGRCGGAEQTVKTTVTGGPPPDPAKQWYQCYFKADANNPNTQASDHKATDVIVGCYCQVP